MGRGVKGAYIMLKYICYNWMPMIADHCLDHPESFYHTRGVTRLHSHGVFEAREIKENDIVFVKTDELVNGNFQKHFLPQIKKNFTLLSGVSSYQVEKGYSIDSIVSNPNLDRWFCTNAPVELSNKIIPVPIGFQERERVGGQQSLIDHLYKCKADLIDKQEKILLPYHNFATNPKRQQLFDNLSKLSFVDACESKLEWIDYMKLLDKYKFVFCLEGSGPDVHRNYEALLVNCIPINIQNNIEPLFQLHNLPGLFLKSWDDVSSISLAQSHDFSNVKDFLTIEYHANIIGKTYERS